MTALSALNSIRIIPRDSEFLDRKLGSRGEIFFDQASSTLRLYDGITTGGIPLLRADLSNAEVGIGAVLGDNPPTGNTVQTGSIWFNTSNGRLYIYYNDGNSTQWVQPTTPSYGSGSGGATTINQLSDVTITSPSAGQVLKYNGSAWINDADATAGGAGVGTVTTVSVASANGFSGTVATASSTPAITISTSVTGLLKGNATAISAAVSGTDYQAPVSATGILKSSGVSGNVSAATAGTDYQAPITLTTTGSSGAATFSSGILNIPQYSGGGGGGTSSNSFEIIAVAGQTSLTADSANDTLTLVAGSNITITTNSSTDTITIAASGSAGNIFETIAVAGQSDIVADSSTDTLYLAAGTGISITTNAGTDTITISNSMSAGATTFAALTDNAGLTADRFYLPAITQLAVTANGSSAYRFDQYSTADNPTIYAISGTTIAFDLSVGLSSHPFLIRYAGANYSTGLVHVTTGGTVSTGASAQGKTSGTLYWKIPAGISGTYGYLCSNHGSMAGSITVKDISAI